MVEDKVTACVKYTLMSTEREEELHGLPAAIASGLSSVVKSASFVESMASTCLRTGSISIGLYAFVSSGERDESSKLFTPYGPTARSEGNNSARTSTTRNHAEGDNGERNEGSERNHAEGDIDERNENAERNRNGEGSRAVNLNRIRNVGSDGHREATVSDSAPYAIPEEMVARCMSFFLDISGSTSHPSNYGAKDLEGVNAKKLSKAVKSIFKKYKSNLQRRGMKTHGLQYLSLLPNVIRGKKVNVPLIRLCRSESGSPYTKTGIMMVNLDISKADSNSKDQNIALVASLLHHRNHGINVEDILAGYADMGLGPDGCKRNSLCRAGRLKSSCTDAARDLCEIYAEVNGERKVVGKGVVDPYTTFLFGCEVPPSSIMVRVKSVIVSSGLEGRRCEDGSTTKMNAYIWPKNDIGRVQLLGDLGDVVGTGILVQENLVTSKRKPRNNLDVSYAVFVCEVVLEEGMAEENYPFSDWYKSCSMRRLGLPFVTDTEKVPENLGDICHEWRKSALWHRDFVQRGSPTNGIQNE